MTQTELFSQVAAQMAIVLSCDADEIVPETCADNIETWDSLRNVKLLIHLERTFKIRFSGVETTSLENVGELVDLIASKLDR